MNGNISTIVSGVVCASGGRLIVSEQRRVQVLTMQGEPQQVITPPRCGSLFGLTLSCSGWHVVVADYETQRLHKFELLR